MTATRHSNWKLLDWLGDVDFITYGGTLIYTDTTGQCVSEAEVIVPVQGDQPTWVVYRFMLDRCTFVEGILSDNPHHWNHPAWFADDLMTVCQFHGVDMDRLIQQLCDENPVTRAMAYQMIGEYHGWANFDSYPLFLNRDEIEARYPEDC